METVFFKIDDAIVEAMRYTVRVSLIALAIIAVVAWPAAANIGLPLYVAGFAVCAASAAWGRRLFVRVSRAIARNSLRKAGYRAAPDDVRRRVTSLIGAKSPVPIGVHMPETDDGRFLLGILENSDRADILISPRALECPDDVLQLMLGHEIGHLHDPPERSAPRNDLVLFAWCVMLAHAGASLWLLAAAYALRLAVVGFVRMLECWIREVRADIYGAHLFGDPARFDRVLDEIERAGAESRRTNDTSPILRRGIPLAVLAAFAASVVYLPNFAAFAAVELIAFVAFARMPTSHPPTSQRRHLALHYTKSAA